VLIKKPSTKINIIANFAGKAWAGIINFAFVPLYIKFLGIEAYGLIGIFISLIALLSILDMGLSATLNRALSRIAFSPDADQEARNLTRTFEVIYWVIGIVIGVFVLVLSPVIATRWVRAEGIPLLTVQHALMMMGFVVAIQWPSSLYSGALAGLQRQVLMNGIRSTIGTLQAVGAILVLWLISPTIYAYFIWQLVMSVVQTIVLYYAVWSALPRTGSPPAFDRLLLNKHFQFAAGMTGISVVVTVLTQMDKIILSKMLPLHMFGYYVIAANIGSMINVLVQPVSTAVFPKLAQLSGTADEAGLSKLYHKSCQMTSVIVIPAAMTFLFYSEEILTVWLRNAETVQQVNLIAKIMVLGSCLNALMTLPYNLQLAYGWTKLALVQNLVSILVLAPLLIFMVQYAAAVGAAIVWVILNIGYLLILMPIMHTKLIKHELRSWTIRDVGLPAIAAVATIAVSRFLMPSIITGYLIIPWLAASAIVTVSLTALAASEIRRGLKELYNSW